MSSTLAERTLERATAAMRSGPVACLPEIVKLLGTLSANSVEVSVSELAEVIQKDPVILSKVIGAANTYGYNPTGIPVTTVTQAVHVIGYERIRTLAMSLVLMKHANGSQSPDERQNAVALALASGCVAQAAAGSRMLLDPEQAFVCASLRNFGRIILATFMAEEYSQVSRRESVESSDELWIETFGMTPLDLGRELLKASDLPEPILAALRDLPPAAIAVLDTAPDAQMLAVTDFSARLSSLILKSTLSAAEFAQQTAQLAERYNKVLPAIGDEIGSLLKSTEEQFSGFMRTFGIKSLPSNSLTRLRQRVAGIDPAGSIQPAASPNAKPANATPVPGATTAPFAAGATAPPAPAATAASATPAAAAPLAPPKPTFAPRNTGPVRPTAPVTVDSFDWAGGAEQLARLLRMPGVSHSEILKALLEIVQRGLSAPECILFASAPGAAEHTITHFRGVLGADLKPVAAIRSSERTVFGVCLARHENVMIHAASDPKILPYLPEWLRGVQRLGCFALLPIGAPRETCGLILAGWPNANQLSFNSEHNRLLRPLLSLASKGR